MAFNNKNYKNESINFEDIFYVDYTHPYLSFDNYKLKSNKLLVTKYVKENPWEWTDLKVVNYIDEDKESPHSGYLSKNWIVGVEKGGTPSFYKQICTAGPGSYILRLEKDASGQDVIRIRYASGGIFTTLDKSKFKDNVLPKKLIFVIQGAGGGGSANKAWTGQYSSSLGTLFGTWQAQPGKGGGSAGFFALVVNVGEYLRDFDFKIVVGAGGAGGNSWSDSWKPLFDTWHTGAPGSAGEDSYLSYIDSGHEEQIIIAKGGGGGSLSSIGSAGKILRGGDNKELTSDIDLFEINDLVYWLPIYQGSTSQGRSFEHGKSGTGTPSCSIKATYLSDWFSKTGNFLDLQGRLANSASASWFSDGANENSRGFLGSGGAGGDKAGKTPGNSGGDGFWKIYY